MKKKIFKALLNAELSFQFYRDKMGTPNFLITCNPQKEGRDFHTGIDRIIFAENLINSGTCSVSELVFLCDFFDEVRRLMLKRVERKS